jgi:hypothetical protein
MVMRFAVFYPRRGHTSVEGAEDAGKQKSASSGVGCSFELDTLPPRMPRSGYNGGATD